MEVRKQTNIFDLPDDILRFLIEKFLSTHLRVFLVCRRFYYLFINDFEKRNSLYLKYCAFIVNRSLRRRKQYVCGQCGEVHSKKIGKCDKQREYKESCEICGKCSDYVHYLSKKEIRLCRSCSDRNFTTTDNLCRVCNPHFYFISFGRLPPSSFVWNVLQKRHDCSTKKKVRCGHCQKTYFHTEVPKDCPETELCDLSKGENVERLNNYRKFGSCFNNNKKN